MDEIARAIADPVRRTILESLAVRSRTVNELAALFPVSRPAVSRHLRVLRASGLVTDRVVGRNRMYTFHPGRLGELDNWLSRLAPLRNWGPRLDALATEVHRTTFDRRIGERGEEIA